MDPLGAQNGKFIENEEVIVALLAQFRPRLQVRGSITLPIEYSDCPLGDSKFFLSRPQVF
jgi:hypothetical protein